MKANNPLDKIKNPKRTQVITGSLLLSEFLSEEIIKNLKQKFIDYGDPVVTSINILVIPRKDKDKNSKNQNKKIEFINIEQPSEKHFQEKKVVIASSSNEILDIFLK